MVPSVRWIKWCLLGFALGLIAYCLVIIFAPLQGERSFVDQVRGKTGVSDFVIIYDAGRIAASVDRFRVYDSDVQLKWCNETISPNRLSVPFYLQYPPWFFTLMAPLSILSIKPAFVIWTCFWLVAASATLFVNLRKSAVSANLDRWLIVSMAMASAPAVISMKLGQTSLWLLTCIALFCYGWRSKGDKLCAAALVLSSIKLQYCLFFVIPMLALKRWRMLVFMVVFGTLMLVVTMADVGWQSFLQYPSWVSRIESSGASGVAADAMVNIQGLCRTILPARPSFTVGVAAFVMALIYLFRLWWRGRRLDADAQTSLLATTIAVSLVTSLHTHFHDCILLAAAAALALKKVEVASHDPSPAYRVWHGLILNYPMLSWICYIYQDQLGVTILALVNVAIAVCSAICSEKLITASNVAGEIDIGSPAAE